MKKAFLFVGVFLLAFAAFFSFVDADLSFPTTTSVHFYAGGVPYDGQVIFTVTCYGYKTGMPPVEKEPGTYTPEPVYWFKDVCMHFDCEIDEMYYLNYRHVDYCDVNGTANGQEFVVQNYSSRPMTSECKWGDAEKRHCAIDVNLPDYVTPIQTTTPSVTPLSNQPVSFFDGIICFFKKLFGGKC